MTNNRPSGWAILHVAVSVAIIWALTVHGHGITHA